MTDEFEIDLALEREGVCGRIDPSHTPALLDELMSAVFLNGRTKNALEVIFDRHLDGG